MTRSAARRTLPRMDASETPDAGKRDDHATTFGVILRALAGVVPTALIDDAGWVRVRESVEELPAEPGVGFGFELRLGEPAAGTDFSISLPPDGALADHYIGLGARSPDGSPEAAFGRHLAGLRRGVPWVELLAVEYDTSSGPTRGLPGYFVRIRPGVAEGGADGFPGAEAMAAWIADAVGWRLAEGEGRALAGAFDGIEAAGGEVDCVAVMPTRPERAFRVVSRPVEPSRALPLLEGLRWKGPPAAVDTFLSGSEGLFDSLRIAVGVTADGVLPGVGLEVFRGTPGTLGHGGVGGWEPFLARLRDEGLCQPEKMAGLLNWPGREIVFHGRRTLDLLTGLAHLKVSFEERESGVAVGAKAYPYGGYMAFGAAVGLVGGGVGGDSPAGG